MRGLRDARPWKRIAAPIRCCPPGSQLLDREPFLTMTRRRAQPARISHTDADSALSAFRTALSQSCGQKATKEVKQLAVQSRRIRARLAGFN
jgi:hypothetical protein